MRGFHFNKNQPRQSDGKWTGRWHAPPAPLSADEDALMTAHSFDGLREEIEQVTGAPVSDLTPLGIMRAAGRLRSSRSSSSYGIEEMEEAEADARELRCSFPNSVDLAQEMVEKHGPVLSCVAAVTSARTPVVA